jgi:D-alanyl-D-alanine carboxypeptidase
MQAAETFLSSEAEAGRFRGSVLLSRNGQILLRKGYGFANEEWRIHNTATTRFRIGSVTKMFTAAAILKLVDDLNERVDRWLDDLPDAWRAITVHQLLTHTSGLRDHIAVPAKRTLNLTGATPAELINLIASEPLLAPPGTAWAYSNTGYLLLGLLIEKISNRSYAEYLRDEIFQPFGMTRRFLPKGPRATVRETDVW